MKGWLAGPVDNGESKPLILNTLHYMELLFGLDLKYLTFFRTNNFPVQPTVNIILHALPEPPL